MNAPQNPQDPHGLPAWAQRPAQGSPGYGPTWDRPHSPAPRNGAGTTALVLGIVGAALSLIPLVGIVAWPVVIVGAVFGVIGLVNVRRGSATNRGAALAGLLCSIAGLVVCIAYAAAFGSAVEAAGPVATDPGLGQADPSFSTTLPADASTAPTVPLYPAVEPAAPSPDSIPGTGTFLVGSEVEPGTYRSAPAEDSFMPWCYWSRLSGLDGTLDSILANNGGDGTTLVTISASDTAFETSGCQAWERVE